MAFYLADPDRGNVVHSGAACERGSRVGAAARSLAPSFDCNAK
jgi:hypothetical protein